MSRSTMTTLENWYWGLSCAAGHAIQSSDCVSWKWNSPCSCTMGMDKHPETHAHFRNAECLLGSVPSWKAWRYEGGWISPVALSILFISKEECATETDARITLYHLEPCIMNYSESNPETDLYTSAIVLWWDSCLCVGDRHGPHSWYPQNTFCKAALR